MSKKNNSVQVTDSRSANLKAFSIGSGVIVFAIILVLNILLSVTLEKRLKIDLSQTSQNKISKETQEFVDSLPADTKIRIVGLFDEPQELAEDTPFVFAIPLLQDLEDKSDGKIDVSYVNPQTHPSIMRELDPNGTLIIDGNTPYVINCNGKVRALDLINDCFIYDSSLYQTYGSAVPVSNNVESTFVNTLVGLTTESSGKVYFLTGIQEKAHTYLDAYFASANIAVEDLPVNEDFKVPDDCDLLIINNPEVDISEAVQEGLKDYIRDQKKSANIIISAGMTETNANETFPHLNNVLAEVNISIVNGLVVDNKPDHISSDGQSIFRGDLINSFSGFNISNTITYANARCIAAMGTSNSSATSEPIIVTSEAATIYLNDNGETTVEDASKCSIAMAGTYQKNLPSHVYVFGTEFLTTDYYLQATSQQDFNALTIKSLLKNIISSDSGVEVAPKPLADYTINYSKVNSDTMTAMSIIFLAALPIGCAILAAVVYHRRVHL